MRSGGDRTEGRHGQGRLAALLLTGLLGAGCAPPDAPARLEHLCGYLFDHIGDDDDDALVEGVRNLRTWLRKGENFEETQKGYSITRLKESTVDDLDSRNRSARDLLGAAVAYDHRHKTKSVVRALTVANQMKVFPDNYEDYARSFDRNSKCYPGRECDALDGETESQVKIAGADLVTHNSLQYRWVEVDDTWISLRRNWLKRPADAKVLGTDIVLEGQFFVGVTMPWQGGTARIIATWMDADYGALPATDDFIKGQIVNSMQKEGKQLEEYLGD
jgi:hypothetical protein